MGPLTFGACTNRILPTPWEAEIDRLMNEQMITIDYSRRKQTYDRVPQVIADNLPLIFLATPNVLVGAKNEVGNIQPGVLAPYALLNTRELYFKGNVASNQ